MVEEVDVLAELQRILTSSVFANSPRSGQFLEYCVSRSLRGDRAQLKETTIAVEIFLREATYDPKVDPIVRVHARRVREKLQLYYRTTGRDNPVAIHLPKGSYVAQFTRVELPAEPTRLAQLPADAQEDSEYVCTPGFTASPPPDALEQPVFAGLAATAETVSQAPKARALLFIAVVVLILAAVAITVYRQAIRRSSAGAASPSPLRPLDSLPQGASSVVWSPNRMRVAFVQTDERRRSFVYTLDMRPGQSPQRLTHTPDSEYRPAWSPDGHQLAFLRFEDGNHFSIVKRDLSSGIETTTHSFPIFMRPDWFQPVLDWSPDGKYLLTSDQIAPDTPVRLILLRIKDEARFFLTSPPVGSTGDVDAKFSPDGRYVAFHRGGLGDLFVLRLRDENASDDIRQLTSDNRGVQGIAFSADSKEIYFGRDGTVNDIYGIYSIPVSGGKLAAVTPEGFAAVDPTVLDKGSLAFRHLDVATEVVELANGSSEEKHLFSGNEIDRDPSYSPDGEAIVFVSTRSGAEELWDYRSGTAAPEQLTHFDGKGFLFTPHWSPSGDHIAFGFRKDGATNICVIDLKSRAVRNLTNTNSRNYNPVYSRDGKKIFFSSNEDGTPRLWQINTDGQESAEPLFTQASSSFTTSPDGQWLYFLHNAPPLGLYRLNLLDGTTNEVLQLSAGPAFVGNLVMLQDGIYLAISEPDEPDVEIVRIDPATWQKRTAWRIPAFSPMPAFAIQGFDVSPDGKRLLTTRLSRYLSNMYVTKHSN